MPYVSVIVPVYKVEAYLEKCLTSLVNQSLSEIEIIVVNDGSPDQSDQIMERFVNQYPDKIQCIYQENKGLSVARNVGIKASHAPYIGFVDSDDEVDVEMFEKLYQKAVTGDFDLVVCDVIYSYPDGSLGQTVTSGLTSDLKTKAEIKKVFHKIYPVAWNKLYKRNLFQEELFYKPKVWFEDVELLFRLLPSVGSIGVITGSFYHYLQRDGQITKTFDERIYHYIDNWNGIMGYYQKQGMYDEYRHELEYNYTKYIFATFLKSCLKFDKREYGKAVQLACQQVKEKVPHRYQNPYFYHNGLKGVYLLFFNSFLGKLLYYFKSLI